MSKLNTPEELVKIITDECDEAVPDTALIGGAAYELERRIAELEVGMSKIELPDYYPCDEDRCWAANYRARIAELEAEVERLRTALRASGDELNGQWHDQFCPYLFDLSVCTNQCRKARAALGEDDE